MKKIFNKEFVIGLSVIIAIAILVFGIDYLKGINIFKPANFYIANYDNVAGLESSAPVMIDGFKVGQVREINFNYEKPGKIEVILALNKDLHLPEDSEAIIANTLLNGAYIEIKLGHSKKNLEIGSEVHTNVHPDLMASISDEMLPAVTNVIPKIDALLSQLTLVVSDPALKASIQRLDGITDNVLDATAGLKGTMGNDVPFIMSNVGRASHNLDSLTYNLALLSYQLKTLPLKPTMDNVFQITENLNHFSQQLNNQESTLGLLTTDPALYNRLNRVSADIDSLIVDIKKNPKRYISIKLL